MKAFLTSLVRGKPADYLEIRLEETETTRVEFQGKRLENIGESLSYGGNIRALVGGGWGFVSFNSLEGLEEKVELAIRQARVAAALASEPVRLAPVPVVEDVVRVKPILSPREVALERKKNLIEGYARLMLDYAPEITSASVRYFDRFTRLYFTNSEGTYIEQEKLDMGCNVAATATANGLSQSAHTGFGSSNDFSFIVGKEKEVEEVCRSAVGLLRAEPITGGQYPVVLDPHLAGVFIHEAFGHLSEADGLYEDENMRRVMTLGTRFGQDFLNVYDSGLDEGARGFLAYDDEGVRTQKTYLIKDGILVGRLHSRETAAKMGEAPTGNARAISYQFPPIVRMRNTCIEPGPASFEDLLRGIKLGVYAKGSYGGQTNGEMFTFTAGEAYMIRDGQLAEMVRDVTLTGNVFHTLKNIDLIGRDFTIFDSAGGCGKGGQMPLPVSHWAPHVRIQNVVIGGKK